MITLEQARELSGKSGFRSRKAIESLVDVAITDAARSKLTSCKILFEMSTEAGFALSIAQESGFTVDVDQNYTKSIFTVKISW
jgi:hypothetical protein